MKDVNGIAVDFGGTKIAAARLTNGIVVESLRRHTRSDATVEEQVSAIAELIEQLGADKNDDIGVAVTGRVDENGCWYAVNANTLQAVSNVPLKALLEARLGRSLSIVNDVVAGAVAEARFGAGKDSSLFAYLSVSTGVGGVCVRQGQPMVSANGLAGHIGFMTSRFGDRQCGSGRWGTLESIASGRAIEHYATQALSESCDARALFAHHHAGASWATAILTRSAEAIADMSSNLAAAIGIDCVVLGGSVALADGYLPLVNAAFDKEPALFRLPAYKAQLGQQSVLVGALCAGREERS